MEARDVTPAPAAMMTRADMPKDGAAKIKKEVSPEVKTARREGRDTYARMVGARVNAALTSDTPFLERLTHFWANHFAVSADKLQTIGLAGTLEFEAIRPQRNRRHRPWHRRRRSPGRRRAEGRARDRRLARPWRVAALPGPRPAPHRRFARTVRRAGGRTFRARSGAGGAHGFCGRNHQADGGADPRLAWLGA